MRQYIYADNAATSKIDKEALERMQVFLYDNYGNPSQPYSFSRLSKLAIKEARETISCCIGSDPDEIYFTSGGTESDNWAIKGFMKRQSKNRLVVSSIEHHAVLNSANTLKREGYNICYLNVTKEGIVLPSFLEKIMDDGVALVSIMSANNEVGSIQPIGELARVAHEHGATFHTDAVQAVGHFNINVKKLDVDMLSASAHKFNGPRGIGFLYIKNGTDLYPFMDGGAQENGFRAGTENVAAIAGMAVALKNNCNAIEENNKYLINLENELIAGLKHNNLDFIRNGAEQHLPGNVSLSFRNSDGEMLLHRMDLMGIYISTGSACDSQNTQVSHVIRAIQVPSEYANGTIRISLGKDNTSEEVSQIVYALTKILKG